MVHFLHIHPIEILGKYDYGYKPMPNLDLAGKNTLEMSFDQISILRLWSVVEHRKVQFKLIFCFQNESFMVLSLRTL